MIVQLVVRGESQQRVAHAWNHRFATMEVGVAFPRWLGDSTRSGRPSGVEGRRGTVLLACPQASESRSTISTGSACAPRSAALTEPSTGLLQPRRGPWHAPAMLAQQCASIDVISGGRFELAVGVGGRHDDYDALGSSFAQRHARLDDTVLELQRMWAGGLARRSASRPGTESRTAGRGCCVAGWAQSHWPVPLTGLTASAVSR